MGERSLERKHGRFEPLATVEWSPVEPQLEKKFYAAGIGDIQEQVILGGHERFSS
jgi:hypothetical protein